MKRREFINQTASVGVILAAGSLTPTWSLTGTAGKLTPPAKGKIPVAFAISEGVTVIDFAGPWEVFQDVHVPQRGQDMDEQMPFELFTVSDKTEPLARTARLAGAACMAAKDVHVNRRDHVRVHRRFSTWQVGFTLGQGSHHASRLLRSICKGVS